MPEESVSVRVTDDGQVGLPESFRRRTGLVGGSDAILTLVDGELRLRSAPLSLDAIQALVKPYFDASEMTVDRFLAEKRDEARHEDERFG